MSRIFQIKSREEGTPSAFEKGEDISEDMLNLIQETRKAVSCMSENDRFNRAKTHLEHALKYKNPRTDIFKTEQGFAFKLAYFIQTSLVWEMIIRSMSFIYMYLIVFLGGESDEIYKFGSLCGMIFFWSDLLLELLHLSRDQARKSSKYSKLIYLKLIILILLLIEQILIVQNVSDDSGRPINPLRILRVVLPILFVSEVRRSFEALFSAYEEFFVFVLFDIIIVMAFSLIGSIIIQVPDDVTVDEFTSNYTNLGHMIFIIYVTGSYDAFPDNQLIALQISKWFELFFIVFVFLNMFLFSSIPGSLLFDVYINTRSKYILIDEIKMQHSLILAFVSLGEVNYEINIKTLINFFHFLFQDRVRYIDAITELCLKLNDDGNCSVHVLQFIQLGRVLQENPYLKPPLLPDWSSWINFRKSINEKIPLKTWLINGQLEFVLSLLALGGFINSFLCLYSYQHMLAASNLAFSYLFLLDIALRIIGKGVQWYSIGEWNMLDCAIILLSFACAYAFQNPVYSALFKLFRLYRIFPLFKNLLENRFFSIQFLILQKFQKLLGTVIIILPLTARFFPLFMVTFYILGIIGMELFYNISRLDASQTYGFYNEYSHFQQFINTQFYLVQVLTEAGWSSVAFDYANRVKDIYPYYLILLFFMMCHVIIVLVLAAVLKGIIWFVYLTVSQLLDKLERSKKNDESLNEVMQNKIKQFIDLESKLKSSTLFKYDSVIKRQLFELKSDAQIIYQLNQISKESKITNAKPKCINLKLYRQFEADKYLVENAFFSDEQNNFLFTLVKNFDNKNSQIKLSEMECVENEDIYQYLNNLAKEFKIISTKFEYGITPSNLLKKHLKEKLMSPYLNQSNSDIENVISKRTIDFHIFALHLLLDIQTERKKQKNSVIETMADEGIIDECDTKQFLFQVVDVQSFKVDEDSIIRAMYMADTKQNLIDKFEAEYFSDIFGDSFKETNKITIEPLIELEATLTHAIKKLMRYPQISSLEFFKILSEIEINISNKLLRRGSLFKFVFQLNSSSETWFTVHFTSLNETRISFLKHGVWIYHEDLVESEIYYGKDIFKTGKAFQNQELLSKAILMKKLFETFETLALTLNQTEDFFSSNPTFHQYDVFLTYIDISTLERLIPRDIEISKIMAVMLTKEKQRDQTNELEYPITDINIKPPVDLIDFRIDELESETYRKLSTLSALNEEQITANQGLPFAYVLNFLCQISDIMKLYAPNFVHQVETVVNQQINFVSAPPVQSLIRDTTQDNLDD